MSISNTDAFDEFSLLEENAADAALPWRGTPAVRREFVNVAANRRLSALVWGADSPEVVLLHGGGQNAHTWDTVALALGCPLIALDLPGHGHSDWTSEDEILDPNSLARDVSAAIAALAPTPVVLVGMSLGGATSIAVAAQHPNLVSKLALIDVTPSVSREKSANIASFLVGRDGYSSLDEMIEWTTQFNPTRSPSSIRRGVLHNAIQLEDGTWSWRHQLGRRRGSDAPDIGTADFEWLWDQFESIKVPVLLVRGALSRVVDDSDVDEFLRRQPTGLVETVDGAGHSIQGDQPVQLAEILRRFITS